MCFWLAFASPRPPSPKPRSRCGQRPSRSSMRKSMAARSGLRSTLACLTFWCLIQRRQSGCTSGGFRLSAPAYRWTHPTFVAASPARVSSSGTPHARDKAGIFNGAGQHARRWCDRPRRAATRHRDASNLRRAAALDASSSCRSRTLIIWFTLRRTRRAKPAGDVRSSTMTRSTFNRSGRCAPRSKRRDRCRRRTRRDVDASGPACASAAGSNLARSARAGARSGCCAHIAALAWCAGRRYLVIVAEGQARRRRRRW